jgi:transcriptional regulator with XRE-family HTH domain
VAEGSPTVRRRELGALLRKLREEKGMSVKQVTEHLMCSPSKVSRIETGQRGATLRDVRDLCNLYDVTDKTERDRMMSLAREGKQQGWWQSYDLPYSSYVGFESEAVRIKDYDSAVIPGLLQTTDYARALHQAAMPQRSVPGLTPDIIDRRIEARLIRQRLLTRTEPGPLQFWTILDEAALHRVVGSIEVMQAQLRQLIELSKLANVTIQVIPYDAGAHPALDSTFNILEFNGSVPDIVYVEGLVGWIYLERSEDLSRYLQVFDILSQMSLTPERSIDLIAKVNSRMTEI